MNDATPDKDRHHADDPHARPPGHERKIDRDINLRAIALTVGGLTLGTVLAFVLMWFMHELLLETEIGRDPEPPALSEALDPVIPPLPRLQAAPERDMEQFVARENVLLSSYGWKDEAAGTIRIPVDRAMEVLADQGRTALSTAPDPTAGDGNVVPPPAAEDLAGGMGAGVLGAPTGGAMDVPATGDAPPAAAPEATEAPGPTAVDEEGTSGQDGREQ